jgi:hypothetical protein
MAIWKFQEKTKKIFDCLIQARGKKHLNQVRHFHTIKRISNTSTQESVLYCM